MMARCFAMSVQFVLSWLGLFPNWRLRSSSVQLESSARDARTSKAFDHLRLALLLGLLAAVFSTLGCGESARVEGDTKSVSVAASGELAAAAVGDTPVDAAAAAACSPAADLVVGPSAVASLEEGISGSVSGRKLWLGIQAEPAPKALLDQFDLSCGLVVRQVVAGGPSDGLLRDSDLITQFNGRDLACQKLLCTMIAELGPQLTQLTIIRKAKAIQVEVLPQPIEIFGDGQIVQYTVLADPNSKDVVDVPVGGNQVVEKFRLFVVQPIVAIGEGYDQHKLEADPNQLQLERVVKFGINESGRQMLTVQESGRTLYYTEDDIETACSEVRQLWQHLENQP